ncbi:MAG TPA: DUF255 domain-containing protein [Gemmataceae bacterium]|nr:DUF255 domain-containing protein [Gemmataceae bacterium]
MMRQHVYVMILALVGGRLANAGDPPAPGAAQARPSNRLAQESSPYLLQHAHNPVDWYPWGPEAFAKARSEGKLVFLSIGYSSCHWCHVMERESFENPEVAKLLNQSFVCIKVDREERPDIDTIYMTALNVLRQRGGWPLSMFLTSDGKPIIGGTYWPPEDKQIQGNKVPGFKSVLQFMVQWKTEKPKELEEQAERVAATTVDALGTMLRGRSLVDLNRDLVDQAVKGITSEFDPDYGGFGSRERGFRGTKFPTPSYLELLLHEAGRTQSPALQHMLNVTLDRMARGGIYDHVGGGFHRYSTERTWLVPHFEKMLYDNAQLVEVYAKAYRLTRRPLYRQVVEETLAFVDREMTAPSGGFYSALDADSDGQEGLYYVWTDAQLDAAIADKADAALFKKVYGADGPANFESNYHILHLPKPLAEAAKESDLPLDSLQPRLRSMRERLLALRAMRPRPFRDTKILTSWNGEMIAAYAVAGQALAEPRYQQTAARAADFVLKNLRTPEGRLLRTFSARPGQAAEARLNGYLDDYAYLAHGLLCLHDATGERRWLDEATQVTERMVDAFGDKDAGGFFYTSRDHEKLFARSKDQFDSAQPSGNSVAARNLVRLWTTTRDARFQSLAEKTLQAFSASLKIHPTGLTAMAGALALHLEAQADRQEKDSPKKLPDESSGPKKSDSVVKVSATVQPEKPGPDGKQVVTVLLAVDKGWHIYANPPGLEDLVPVQTTVSIRAKTKLDEVKIDYPEGTVMPDMVLGKYRVYENKVAIKATVRRAPGATEPIEVAVKFQACSDKQCLLPATKILMVPSKDSKSPDGSGK